MFNWIKRLFAPKKTPIVYRPIGQRITTQNRYKGSKGLPVAPRATKNDDTLYPSIALAMALHHQQESQEKSYSPPHDTPITCDPPNFDPDYSGSFDTNY